MSNSAYVDIVIPAYSGNYTKGKNKVITEICIHHMAGIGTATSCGKTFQKVGRNGSANYGVGIDGKVGLYVNEQDIAWANSNWASNCRSVSIETANCEKGGDWKVSDVTFNKLVLLVADIAKRNNMGRLSLGQNLTWHSMYAATACCGKYLKSKLPELIEKANAINFPTTEIDEEDEVARYQKIEDLPEKYLRDYCNEMVANGYLKGDENGNFDLTVDMIRGWIVQDRKNKRYNSIDEMPDGYWKEYAKELVAKGVLSGEDGKLDITIDLLRGVKLAEKNI